MTSDNPLKVNNISKWAENEIGLNYNIDLIDAKNFLGLNISDQFNFYFNKFLKK